jgi:hypothetical protein
MDTKTCKKCGAAKSSEAFYKASTARDGLRPECIDCAKAYRRKWYEANREAAIRRTLKWRDDNRDRYDDYRAEYRQRPERKRKMRDLYYRRTFGISADDVDALIEVQGGVCAICGITPEREASWHVDHDHETGAVRGVLCIDCNHGIGKLGDSIERLERAIAYLRRSA